MQGEVLAGVYLHFEGVIGTCIQSVYCDVDVRRLPAGGRLLVNAVARGDGKVLVVVEGSDVEVVLAEAGADVIVVVVVVGEVVRVILVVPVLLVVVF